MTETPTTEAPPQKPKADVANRQADPAIYFIPQGGGPTLVPRPEPPRFRAGESPTGPVAEWQVCAYKADATGQYSTSSPIKVSASTPAVLANAEKLTWTGQEAAIAALEKKCAEHAGGPVKLCAWNEFTALRAKLQGRPVAGEE